MLQHHHDPIQHDRVFSVAALLIASAYAAWIHPDSSAVSKSLFNQYAKVEQYERLYRKIARNIWRGVRKVGKKNQRWGSQGRQEDHTWSSQDWK